MNAKQEYFPYIDGMRAIAVLAVIFFHIDKAVLPGGFVGVDIFFVISGYLISRNILTDLDKNCFSLAIFYSRRIKRILPPMLLVIFVVLIITQLFFLPEDSKDVSSSALWSLISLSNVYFWLYLDTGYFAQDSNQIPLLHLWSLGVEEQYYLLWPFFLMAIYKRLPIKLIIFISIVVTTSSFIFGEMYFSRDPSFVYYMLPTRAGELLLGSIVAILHVKNISFSSSGIALKFMSFSGFILIIISVCFLSEDKPFPGFRAVMPTIGASLLLFSGTNGSKVLLRLLSLRPLVFVGILSYSAYLWHWPLLAMYHYGGYKISVLSGAIILIITFIMAWLTYIFVEKPTRSLGNIISYIFIRLYLIPASTLAVFLIVAIYFDGYGLKWIFYDYKNSLISLRSDSSPAFRNKFVCQKRRVTESDLSDIQCVVGNKDYGSNEILLVGDSNAAHYVGMLSVFAEKGGFSFRNIASGGCPLPLKNPDEFVSSKKVSDCRQSSLALNSSIEKYKTIIVSVSWEEYANKNNLFFDRMFETIGYLRNQGKKIILLGKVPAISSYDRQCREKQLSYPLLVCDVAVEPVANNILAINTKLSDFAKENEGIYYFDLLKFSCPNNKCAAFDVNGKALYYDKSHLSLSGSTYFGNLIFNKIGIPPPFDQLATHSTPVKSLLSKP